MNRPAPIRHSSKRESTQLGERGAPAPRTLQLVWIGLGAVSLTLVGNAWLALHNASEVTAAESRSAQTQTGRVETHALVSAMKDAGSGVRGYLLTGRDAYLELHRRALTDVHRLVSSLERRAPQSLVPPAELETARRLIDRELALLDRVISQTRNAKDEAAAVALARESFSAGQSTIAMDELRGLFARMDARGRALYAQQERELAAQRRMATWTTLTSLALGLALVAVALLAMRRQFEALRAYERRTEQLESVMRFIPIATGLLRGDDCTPLLVNPAYRAMLSATGPAPTPMRQWPEVRERFDAICRTVLATGEPYSEESCVTIGVSSKGSAPPAFFQWSLHRVPLPDGDGYGLLNTIVDMTEQRLAARALVESEARLRLFIEHAPASLAMFDRDMRYLAVSRRWRADYALGDRALIGLNHYDVFPEIGQGWQDVHARALRGDVVRSECDRLVRADGTVQLLRWEVRPWQEDAGAIGGTVIFTEDITELVRAEDDARAMSQWLRVAQAAAGAGTWQWNLHTNENVWSDEVWQLYGLKKGSSAPSYDEWRDAVIVEDRARAEAEVHAAAAAGAELSLEFRVRWPDGTTHHLLSRGAPVRDAEGAHQKYLGIVVDITDRKRAEELARKAERDEALRELSSRLSLAIEGIQDALALFDRSNCLVLCNGAYRRLLDEPSAVLIGRRRDDVFDAWIGRAAVPDAALDEKLRARREALAKDQASVLDFRTRDGRSLRVIDRSTVDGGLVETVWDLTEDEQRAAELRRAYAAAEAASAAKSEFLSSMSHELRTPLNSVLGFAQLLQRDTRDPLSERHRARVEQIVRSGEHLLQLIDDILDLARIESREVAVAHESVDVSTVVREVRLALEPIAAGREVQLESDVSLVALPPVSGDRRRVAQVLLNLGSNGIKYNRPGGRVTFGAEVERPGWVRISVRDTGMGIPEAKHELLFQPFQRAGQEAGPIEGTGIGLVITQRLVKLMGGDVGFRSSPGEGSEFWIILPEFAERPPQVHQALA